MKYSMLIVLALVVGFWLVDSNESLGQPFPLGHQVAPFSLKDYRGKIHSLDNLKTPWVVVAFLGTECPLAKLYGPRLVEMQEKYGPQGVSFLAINANLQDSITEISAYARIHGIEFPILKDLGNRVADQMGAKRTPQVYLLNRQRNICYCGRIDDQYGVGYVRDEPRRNDLAIAIEELLAGKKVSVPLTVATGCHIGRFREPDPNAKITYANRIAHIFQQRCVECHREGDIAPFALAEYDEVAGWAPMIEEVVREQRMPPWHANPAHGHFVNDRLLSEEEKQAIYQWVADGAPEGDPADLPKPREFVTGWQLPQTPDKIYSIQDEPFRVQAEGEVKYQWFEVELGFEEDRWVQGVEILPGNRAVVHHILAFVKEAGAKGGNFGAARGFFAGYVPGLRAKPLPAGMAKFLPAGSSLAFQVHYTPIGSIQFDQSKIGLVFADPEQVTHRVISSSALNHTFEIPPGESNHREEAASTKIPWDSQILSMTPHMHVRGKSFRYRAIFPDGTKKVLLDVPHYDFNWQTEYRLAEGLNLPADTRIHAIAHFDNSADNLNNPDPQKTVYWGDQTWDEMLIGYFLIAIPVDSPVAMPESRLLTPAGAQAKLEKYVKKMFRRADTDGDREISKEESPPILKAAFGLTDTDGNGTVSLEELGVAVKKYMKSR